MCSSFRVRAMPTCKETPAAPAQAAETSAEAAELSWEMKQLGVSWNGYTPKSSTLIGFSVINHPFLGTPILGNHQLSSDQKLGSLTIRYRPWLEILSTNINGWQQALNTAQSSNKKNRVSQDDIMGYSRWMMGGNTVAQCITNLIS